MKGSPLKGIVLQGLFVVSTKLLLVLIILEDQLLVLAPEIVKESICKWEDISVMN